MTILIGLIYDTKDIEYLNKHCEEMSFLKSKEVFANTVRQNLGDEKPQAPSILEDRFFYVFFAPKAAHNNMYVHPSRQENVRAVGGLYVRTS